MISALISYSIEMLYFNGFFFFHFKEVPKDEYSGYCTEGGKVGNQDVLLPQDVQFSFFLSRFQRLPFNLVKVALSELLNKILATLFYSTASHF